MRAHNKLQVVVVVESLGDVLSESVAGSTRRNAPAVSAVGSNMQVHEYTIFTPGHVAARAASPITCVHTTPTHHLIAPPAYTDARTAVAGTQHAPWSQQPRNECTDDTTYMISISLPDITSVPVIGVRPHQVADGAFMRNLHEAIQLLHVLNAIKRWRQSSVRCENSILLPHTPHTNTRHE